jgi:hypothetical protein
MRKSKQMEMVDHWLVFPMLVWGFIQVDVIALFIGAIMLGILNVPSDFVRVSLLVGINLAVITVLFVDFDGPREEHLGREATAAAAKQYIPDEVAIPWTEAGFDVGHMLLSQRQFYKGYIGRGRHAHYGEGDLPAFRIYDTQLEHVNMSKLPNTNKPFGIEVGGGGVYKLKMATLRPLLGIPNLQWLRLDGGLDESVLLWLLDQKQLQVSIGRYQQENLERLRLYRRRRN